MPPVLQCAHPRYVEASQPNSRIRLHLKDFETECGWDHLYIWDGDNIFSGLQVLACGVYYSVQCW